MNVFNFLVEAQKKSGGKWTKHPNESNASTDFPLIRMHLMIAFMLVDTQTKQERSHEFYAAT